jgi:hypothetical protein
VSSSLIAFGKHLSPSLGRTNHNQQIDKYKKMAVNEQQMQVERLTDAALRPSEQPVHHSTVLIDRQNVQQQIKKCKLTSKWLSDK